LGLAKIPVGRSWTAAKTCSGKRQVELGPNWRRRDKKRVGVEEKLGSLSKKNCLGAHWTDRKSSRQKKKIKGKRPGEKETLAEQQHRDVYGQPPKKRIRKTGGSQTTTREGWVLGERKKKIKALRAAGFRWRKLYK